MKITNKVIALFTLCTLFTITAEAQRYGGSPEESAARQTERMTDSLTLSTAQVTKVGEINLKYAVQMDDFRKKAREREDFDRMTMRENMQKIREAQNEELKKVLTTGQYEKFEKMEAERRERRGDRGPGKKGRDKNKKKEKEKENRTR